jgi:phosphoribosyl-dephospho-CoA transferase
MSKAFQTTSEAASVGTEMADARRRRAAKLDRIIKRNRVRTVTHTVATDGTISAVWLIPTGLRVSLARILREYHIRLEVEAVVEKAGRTWSRVTLIDQLE